MKQGSLEGERKVMKTNPYFKHVLIMGPVDASQSSMVTDTQRFHANMCCNLAGSVEVGSIDCEIKPEKGMNFFCFLLF